VPFMRQCKKML